MDEVLTTELKQEVQTLEERTLTVIVRTPEERTKVYQEVVDVKLLREKIMTPINKVTKLAYDTWKANVAYGKSFSDKLDAFEAAGKKAIMAFDKIEEDKRVAEQRRLQAIADEKARKEREKAEQEAARQRQIEEEARKKADEARRLAEAAGAAEKERLLKEAQAAERAAAAANAKAEAKAEQAASVAAPVIEVAKTIEKQKGESTKTTWKGRLIDINLVPKEYLVIIIANIPTAILESAINVFARATKGNVPIPGIEFYPDTNLSMRK